jgi:hypothetical protein
LPSREKFSADHEVVREWLDAMDHATEHGARFPELDLSNGSPADEFANNPEDYRKRAQTIARELATFGGVTLVRGRGPFRLDSPKR